MARMIPPTIHSTVRSGAERRLFNEIARSGDLDAWTCLHSLGLARHDSKRRGELDFVLLSRSGIVVLEVKGGGVARIDGVWTFTDRDGERHRRAEGPIDQAASGMFSLEHDLARRFGYEFTKTVLFGYGVVFPDVQFDARGIDVDPAIVYDKTHRGVPFLQFLERVLNFARSKRPGTTRYLAPDRLEEIIHFCRADFDFYPTFDVLAEDVRAAQERLTTEQMAVLDAAEAARRLIVEGPAGSGKTLLAAEEVRRAARRGQRVLFLCFNRLLADRVRGVVGKETCRGDIVIRTLHQHCGHLVSRSSLAIEFSEATAGITEEVVYDEWLPLYARMAIDEDVEAPFEIVVVDEAQDVFTESYLDVINGSLSDGVAGGSWRAFMDSNNQASVFGRMDERCVERLRSTGRSVLLTANCRNTQPIAFQVNAVTNPKIRTVGRIGGVPVEFEYYRDDATLRGKLQGVLAALRRDGVAPGALTVLFPRIPDRALQEVLTDSNVAQIESSDVNGLGNGTGRATWSTISSFKGLENDVIVLVGIDKLEPAWWSAVAYVGMSRARAKLVVLLSETCRAIREDRLEMEFERVLANEKRVEP